MRRSAIAVGVALGLATALAGCTPELCVRNSDCAVGLVCSAAGQCVVPPSDAGADDGQAAAVDAASDAASDAIDGPEIGIRNRK